MFDPQDDARGDGREDGRERVYDERDRDDDPREGLMRDLDLPSGEERELVVHRDRVYELNGEDSRTLAAVGVFRIVPEHDLDADHGSLEHLHEQGLVTTVDLGDNERGLTLTREGRRWSVARSRTWPRAGSRRWKCWRRSTPQDSGHEKDIRSRRRP